MENHQQLNREVAASKTSANSPGDAMHGGSNSSAAASKGFVSHADQTYNYGDVEVYFASFPSGYRFKPNDEELVFDYLRPKVKNMRLPPNVIRDVEVYKFSPDDLAAKFATIGKHQKEWYFFSPRDRKYRNGDRPNRAAGDGYWKATGGDKRIFKGEKEVGSRRALVFYRGKAQAGSKTDWIMHEYNFKESEDQEGVSNPSKKKRGENSMRLDGWVLCRIYKKTKKYSNRVSSRQQDAANDDINSDQNGLQKPNNQLENNYTSQVPIENGVAEITLMPSNIYNMSIAASTTYNDNDMMLNQYSRIEMYNQSMDSHNNIMLPQMPFDQYSNLLDHHSMAAYPFPMKGSFKNEELADFSNFSSLDSTFLDMTIDSDLSPLDCLSQFDNSDQPLYMTSLDNIVAAPVSSSDIK